MKHLFYKTGIDITNDKSMFNFLHDHFRYDTMNSWNGLKSIANNVKVYNLKLDCKDDYKALRVLEEDQYFWVDLMLKEFEDSHPEYVVGFNGRSGGYLVLYNKDNAKGILPYYIADYTYEEYKEYCRYYDMSLKANRSELIYYTRLVQDFDHLCDEIRNELNEILKEEGDN